VKKKDAGYLRRIVVARRKLRQGGSVMKIGGVRCWKEECASKKGGAADRLENKVLRNQTGKIGN